MRKLIVLLCILISLPSCEKPDNPGRLSSIFENRILDGYFVTAIAFDKEGTAWIGTFDQGLIKRTSKETRYFNSTNSIIPPLHKNLGC